jgi:hypothetical protein
MKTPPEGILFFNLTCTLREKFCNQEQSKQTFYSKFNFDIPGVFWIYYKHLEMIATMPTLYKTCSFSRFFQFCPQSKTSRNIEVFLCTLGAPMFANRLWWRPTATIQSCRCLLRTFNIEPSPDPDVDTG